MLLLTKQFILLNKIIFILDIMPSYGPSLS